MSRLCELASFTESKHLHRFFYFFLVFKKKISYMVGIMVEKKRKRKKPGLKNEILKHPLNSRRNN
jgi:hypothetical protein